MRIPPRLVLGVAAVLVLATSGCAGSGSSTPPAASAASSAPSGLSLVGLGDSIPGGLGCVSPCTSYVEQLGPLASESLGQAVTVTNLATNDSLTSSGLLSEVTSEKAYVDAIAGADIITVQVGFNDWQSSCYWEGRDACVLGSQATVVENVTAILDRIDELRAEKPTAVRVVGYYDNTIGDPNLAGNWQIPEGGEKAFAAFYRPALARFNAAVCEVATKHGALCVDPVPSFNGAKGDKDAGELVGGDHLHPSTAGQEALAAAVDAAGYAPLG